MKILITGSNGVIGSFLSKKLKKHEVYTPKRSAIDFTNRQHVDKLFNSHDRFDLVIHCAAVGGHRNYHDSWEVLDINIRMYYNILEHKNKYDKFITFGSGAENYLDYTPYGLSKKVIHNSILDQFNFYNIKIFGLFGEGEIETRFIRSALNNYINKKPIQIHRNKFMDFFYIEDLWTVVKYYIETEFPPKFIDCCYAKEKRSLIDIAKLINTLGDHEVDINIEDKISKTTKYVGEEIIKLDLPINLIGLENSLKLEYERYKFCN
jgi:nucleoside-diphosphate-sugar epimerase